MPSFHICTHVAGYVVEAPDQQAAVDGLSDTLIAADDGQPKFVHEIVHVEEIDPMGFDYAEAHLVGTEAGAPPVSGFPEGLRLTHWSRDPMGDEVA